MVLNKKFLNTAEGAIASYNYTDLAEGTGNVYYYLCEASTSAGTNYILTPQTIRSETIEQAGTTERTFSLTPFNLPKTIRGTAYFEGVIRTTGTGSINYTITIKKNDTAITSAVISRTESATNTSHNFVIPLEIPLTNFAKGDVLKVVVDPAGGSTTYWGTDPANRDGANITAANDGFTNSRISIPFRLDL